MKNKNFLFSISLGVLFFLVTAYAMILFNNTVNHELEKSVRNNLVDMANQQQISLNRQLDSMLFNLISVSETLPIIGEADYEIIQYVNRKGTELNFELAMLIDNEGMAYTSDREFIDVSHTEYFKNAIKGVIDATEPYFSEISQKEVVAIAVPIYVGRDIDGVLAVEYCTEYLSSLLTSFTDSRGLNLLINSDSEIMLSTNSFVLSFDAFKNAQFDGNETFETVVEDFKLGKSGSISYTLNGVKKFGEYRPIEINDWILFFEISEESMVESIQTISNSMVLNSVIIIIFSFILLLYFVISKNNSAKELEKVAYYDELTHIPNLYKFKILVSEALKKDPDKKYTMVKMDLINFKAVNEMFGFKAGDEVIKTIAEVGKHVENSTFIQARVSAEEFMFFSEKSVFEHLEHTSKDYEERFKSMLPTLSEHQFTFRYGRYFIPEGETDVNVIVGKTNIAHAFAKGGRGANIWDYDDNFTKKVLRDTEIANKMHKALANHEFKTYLQPKNSVENGKISGAEALVRWVEHDGQMVFPNEFIPLFEQNGFIVELDIYMLKNVCEMLCRWRENGKELIPVSINFSRLHLQNKNFIKEIAEIVSSYKIDPKYIEIELTESTVMENEKELINILAELHKNGFLVAIDDFGSGYSSLGMLKNFKVDTLKLDKSFFTDLEEEDEYNRGNLVVESVVALAGNLGIHTVAEGIEDLRQYEFLKKIKCDLAQGYYFSKPIPMPEFENLYFNEH